LGLKIPASRSALAAKQKKDDDPLAFEKQELMVILGKMYENKLPYQDLGVSTKETILECLEKLCDSKGAGWPLRALPEVPGLEGRWRLSFSTDDTLYNLLPTGTQIYIDVLTGPGTGDLNYAIMFPEQSSLKNLVAQSEYTLNTNGLLCFEFKKGVTFKVFGFTVPLPFGRQGSSFVQIVFFDGRLMIERLRKDDPQDSDVQFDAYTVWVKEESYDTGFAKGEASAPALPGGGGGSR